MSDNAPKLTVERPFWAAQSLILFGITVITVRAARAGAWGWMALDILFAALVIWFIFCAVYQVHRFNIGRPVKHVFTPWRAADLPKETPGPR